jgi:hypothetical protein
MLPRLVYWPPNCILPKELAITVHRTVPFSDDKDPILLFQANPEVRQVATYLNFRLTSVVWSCGLPPPD